MTLESGGGNVRLDRRATPGAVDHPDGNLELQMQTSGKDKGHAGKPVHALRGADHPSTSREVTLWNGGVALIHLAMTDCGIVRRIRQRLSLG